jgi:predicted  nucleic acid-binding Zn-ribbon protein
MDKKEQIKDIESQIASVVRRMRRAESDWQYEQLKDEMFKLNRKLDELKK